MIKKKRLLERHSSESYSSIIFSQEYAVNYWEHYSKGEKNDRKEWQEIHDFPKGQYWMLKRIALGIL